MSEIPKTYDVVIAGAGPVGLSLACELRLGGALVLVLEKAEVPASPMKGPPFGMRGLNAPTINAFHHRGLLEAISAPRPEAGQSARDAGNVPHWMMQQRRPGGHFAGIQFFHDRIDQSKWLYRPEGPAGTQLASTMERVETVLAARARAMGVDVLRGKAVDGFEQTADFVTVRARDETFLGRWLVGCDGGRSIIRKLGGFTFEGTDPEFTGYFVQVTITDPEALRPGRHYTGAGMYTFQAPGTIAMVDFDDGAVHRTQPITLDHVQTVLRRVSGTDVTVLDLHLATTWTDRACQATTYRSGRVLLAGDAAHIHSPLGGQGLNLGLGDAMNLGWKLSAAIRGDAPADLLDSYYRERHPVGARVLDWSRAQVALMRPSRSSRALEAIIRDLIDTPNGATYFADRVWGVSLRYDLEDSHPLVGCCVPDFRLADDTQLGEHMRNGKGLLLDFSADERLGAMAGSWKGLSYLASRVEDTFGLNALLIRPDGIIAWVGTLDTNIGSLEKAASRWFGRA